MRHTYHVSICTLFVYQRYQKIYLEDFAVTARSRKKLQEMPLEVKFKSQDNFGYLCHHQKSLFPKYRKLLKLQEKPLEVQLHQKTFSSIYHNQRVIFPSKSS
jgi:hypothetical protein